MNSLQNFSSHDRILILAPHPDDECLATGAFIQRAIAAHAKVRVIFATDGENNPWPQRFVEKKWNIFPEDRARWGARRRREALASLELLGVPANAVRFLGLPDQGITGLLLTGDERPLKMLRTSLREWQPTCVVFPCASDIHPDHSALHVFMKLALDRERIANASILNFIVHTRSRHTPSHRIEIRLTPEEKKRKRDAILCHKSQMALSEKRFVAYAKETETFHPPHAAAATMPQHPVREAVVENGALKLRLHVRKMPWKGAQVCIVAENAGDSVRWILPVPPASRRVHLRDADTGALLRLATVRVRGRDAEIHIPIAAMMPLDRLFVKLERRVLFFDEAGWREVPLPEIQNEKPAAPKLSPWRIFRRNS